MLNDGLLSSVKQDWETPQDDFDKWNKKYNFTFDPCCTLDNCKCPDGLFHDLDQDGLTEPWRGRVFMNPPYSASKLWVPKAYHEARRPGVKFVIGLLPARTDTEVFHKYIWHQPYAVARVGVTLDLLKGRLIFGSDKYWATLWEQEFLINDKGEERKNPLYKKYGKRNPAPFPSMLVKWEFN